MQLFPLLCYLLMDSLLLKLTLFSNALLTNSNKWSKPYSEVMGWLQTCLCLAILCATNRCVHGLRVKWRSGFGMEDGVGLAIVMH